MSDLFWLNDAQMARLEPYFPKSHGKPRVDDRRVLSGIIFINRNGLRWRDAPKEYGCVFRSIRPLIPTTCAHPFRGIRPLVTRCREAVGWGYQV